jgi:hypothetical protein
MIDSITFEIMKHDFLIHDSNKLNCYSYKGEPGRYGVKDRFSNYRGELKKQGIYYPMIRFHEVARGYRELTFKSLEIQVSVPKALFGNNLQEIAPDRLDDFNLKIVEYLEQLGIETKASVIKNAIIKRIDFSKIIRSPINFGQTAEVTRKFTRYDFKPCSNFIARDYGIEKIPYVKYWNTTQGFVIYEKLSQMKAKGWTNEEKAIVKLLHEGKIYRRDSIKFEASLKTKQSVDNVLSRFTGVKKRGFTVQEAFDEELAKKVILDNFDKVFNEPTVYMLSLEELNDNVLSNFMIKENLSYKEKTELFYSVKRIAKIGPHEFWKEMKKEKPGGGFRRFKNNITQKLKKLDKIKPREVDMIGYFRREIEKFKLTK